jgi:hypothetical protein
LHPKAEASYTAKKKGMPETVPRKKILSRRASTTTTMFWNSKFVKQRCQVYTYSSVTLTSPVAMSLTD